MRNSDHLATEVYTFIDDLLKARPTLAAWRRSNNHTPTFTDAEVLTIALMQPSLGTISLKHAYEIVRDNLADAFPALPFYKQWIARVHALTGLVGHLMQGAARQALAEEPAQLYLLDAKPIPVCHPLRHGRVRLLREDGAYFGKTSKGKTSKGTTSKGWSGEGLRRFGFKLRVIAHHTGVVLSAVLTPGNWDDHSAAPALCWSTGGGVALGDQG